MTARYDFTIRQGTTFNPVLLYSQPTFVVKAVTGITKSGRAAVTVPSHGLTRDWSVYVVGIVGMDRLNHKSDDLKVPSKAYLARYVNANSLTLEVDTSRMGAYESGGEILYHPPMDLTGYTARMQIRETLAATTTLVSLTTENGGITLGGTAGTIELLIAATATDDFTATRAVYDLEVINGAGKVTAILEGSIVLSTEVTR